MAEERDNVRRARRSRDWWVVGGVVLVILLLIGVGWTARDSIMPVEVGTRAPDYVALDFDGNPVSISDLRGEVVLLNVWATWCPPCIEEMPSMQRLHERLAPRGLHIVAVSIDARPGERDASGREGGNVAAFADAFDLDFSIWLDRSGGIQRAYRTTGVPESYVIDRDGTIVRKVIGAIEWDHEANIEFFERLLGEES